MSPCGHQCRRARPPRDVNKQACPETRATDDLRIEGGEAAPLGTPRATERADDAGPWRVPGDGVAAALAVALRAGDALVEVEPPTAWKETGGASQPSTDDMMTERCSATGHAKGTYAARPPAPP